MIALVDAITIFPPAKPLKLFTAPLKAMTRAMKVINPKFAKHFGGFINKVMQKARKGDFDTLWNMLPFLVLAAEMYNDEEARKGLEFLISTVDSADDVVAWVDYLALPADGWEGEGDPPQVDAFGSNPQAALPLSFMFRQAQAAPQGLRVSAAVLGATLKRAARRVQMEYIQNLPDALAVMVKELKTANLSQIRKYVFRPSMLAATTGLAAKRGLNALRAFVRGKTNARYAPITVIATVGYLEWEAACGKALDIQAGTEDEPATPEQASAAAQWLEALECNGHGLRGGNNRRELYQLYSRAFADSLNQKFEEAPPDFDGADYEITRYGHGALFHMIQIAQALLSQRAGGPDLKAIEGVRWVWLYKDTQSIIDGGGLTNKNGPDFNLYFREAYMRRVDIILGDAGEPEQWIELKSYKALSETGPGREKLAVLGGKTIGIWSLNKAVNLQESLHRQFSLDRAAANIGHARLQKTEGAFPIVQVESSFEWSFQRFRKMLPGNHVDISPQFGDPTKPTTIHGGLTQPIKHALTASSRPERVLYETNMGTHIVANQHIKYGDLRTMLTDLASVGFTEAAEALAEEVFIDN